MISRPFGPMIVEHPEEAFDITTLLVDDCCFAISRRRVSMIVTWPEGPRDITALRADEVFVFGFFNNLQNLIYNVKPKKQVS
jgi:hypothetical protein